MEPCSAAVRKLDTGSTSDVDVDACICCYRIMDASIANDNNVDTSERFTEPQLEAGLVNAYLIFH